ncbi:hypothetical protein [Sphingomonas glacialis]|uniref:Uncharacterized protein n=1 Tax=Sphingomonas glacialis TaxID=658225 RepID=A0A502FXJ8_9SPHN|nr:hypothetical protein [Sphingomonas glacialis]TPG54179.1 hypothetical protein EAH76_05665 [Sphingomonas glacialis]
MERIDISDGRRVADLVEAVERGDEVVIVRDGAIVAEVRSRQPHPAPATPLTGETETIDLAAIRDLHARFPSLRIDSAATLIREMRDEDDH